MVRQFLFWAENVDKMPKKAKQNQIKLTVIIEN